jgi:hypothetical protein
MQFTQVVFQFSQILTQAAFQHNQFFKLCNFSTKAVFSNYSVSWLKMEEWQGL